MRVLFSRPLAFFLFFLLFAATAVATEAGTSGYSGYFRNFVTFTDYEGGTSLEAFSGMRIRLTTSPSDLLSLDAAYELTPVVRDNPPPFSGTPLLSSRSYRAYDIEEVLYPDDEENGSRFLIFQNLDRAFISLSLKQADIYIGRQPVAFGSARVINPTDVIAPFTYTALVKDERTGVDALRVKTPLGWMGEVDLGVVFGDKFKREESAAFIRSKVYFLKTDVTAMVMYFKENYLAGLSMARSIGDAGSWLEAAYVFSGEDSSEDYSRLSAGLDYSFTDKIYSYIEYHYNGAGDSDPHQYFRHIGETAYTDGAVYLLARHYIAPGFNWQLTPLLTFNGQALINLNDGSFLVSPLFSYSLADEVTMEIGAFVGIGKSSDTVLQPESEFGLYSDVYFASVNIYY